MSILGDLLISVSNSQTSRFAFSFFFLFMLVFSIKAAIRSVEDLLQGRQNDFQSGGGGQWHNHWGVKGQSARLTAKKLTKNWEKEGG